MARNLVNGKRYVGQTLGFEHRRAEHIRMANRPNDSRNTTAIKKYGPESFSWEVLFACNEEQLDDYEARAIKNMGITSKPRRGKAQGPSTQAGRG